MVLALLFLASAPVFDAASLDPSVNPCEDFYAHACGGWIKNNPIPADRATWDAYSALYETNINRLREILEQQKTGQLRDFWASCINEAAIEKKGFDPIKPVLARIDALEKTGLADFIADVHRGGANGLLFDFEHQQDYRDASRWVGVLDQAGLGLPEREYYLKTDARSKTLREQYEKHIAAMLTLIGDKDAAANAKEVVRFETALAKASMPNVDRNDSKKLDHWTKIVELPKGFAWDVYFAKTGAELDGALNVRTPDFFKAVVVAIDKEPLPVWKTYLRWHTARAYAPVLSKTFVDESFAFYQKTLRGKPEIEPRWKRCVTMADDLLGELLGKAFVEKYFAGDAKAKTQVMVQNIVATMNKRIDKLSWMSAATKAKAKEKAGTMANNIGYPDKWRDYSSVTVKADDFVGNVVALEAFEQKRQWAKIGGPFTRGEWQMTPPTVNAYYEPQMNEMNFPAGVLLPPLFDAQGDMAANYGDTGATIGHELTHGFDSDGRQFDSKGNLADWWTKDDEKKFKKGAQCIIDQYKQYVIIDDIKINSELTLGEDIADLGGTIVAYEAYMSSEDKKQPQDKWTAEQRFFLAYGQSFCHNARPEEARLRAATDVHSPPKFRINGVVANMPEFAQAFSCKSGPLVRKKPCQIW